MSRTSAFTEVLRTYAAKAKPRSYPTCSTARCEKHLVDQVVESIKREGSRGAGDNINALRAVLRHWRTWGSPAAVDPERLQPTSTGATCST